MMYPRYKNFKNLCSILPLGLLALIATSSHISAADVTADKGVHLFILSGQSNMAGMNPKLSFIPTVETEFGKEHVIIVKDAKGAQPIRRWDKSWKTKTGQKEEVYGELYDRLMQKVTKAIKGRELESVTFVWMQGERDAKENHADVYAQSFMSVVNQLQKDLGHDDINLVIGRLSDFSAPKRYADWDNIRQIQVDLAEENPRAAWVDTDDLNNIINRKGKPANDLHYTKEGYVILGQRFAEAAIDLIKN